MESAVYYIFCSLAVGGALGLLFCRDYVNAVMSMLGSMIGMAGMLFMMKAFLLSFIMLMVYAGAVMVLFVFVIMLVGDVRDGSPVSRRVAVFGLWLLFCVASAYFAMSLPELSSVVNSDGGVLTGPKQYGLSMFSKFIHLFEIVGAVLLVAMVGIIVIAREPSPKRPKRDML